MDNEFMKSRGYSQEEKYFYEKNQQLIEKRRAELDELRNSAKVEHANKNFWLICPKCGGSMREENLSGIVIDQCSDCNGIYFDNGELETLLEAHDNQSFFSPLKRLFT